MPRQRRQGFIIHLMLLAVLMAPLQGLASVYMNMGTASDMMVNADSGAEHGCLHDTDAVLKNAMEHCKHDLQCSQHCDHCAHCQFFPSTPFGLHQVQQNQVDRGTDIAFVSHIPQVSIRPPRLS